MTPRGFLLCLVVLCGCKTGSKASPEPTELYEAYGVHAIGADRAILLVDAARKGKEGVVLEEVVALAEAEGKVVWHARLPAGEEAIGADGITVAAGVVTVAHTTGSDHDGGPVSLSAFSLADGRLLWTTAVTAQRLAGIHGHQSFGDDDTAIQVETEYEAQGLGSSRAIAAVSRATGAMLWQRPLPAGPNVPVVLPRELIIAGFDEDVVLRRGDGVELRRLTDATRCFVDGHGVELVLGREAITGVAWRDLEDPANDQTTPLLAQIVGGGLLVQGCGVRGGDAVFVVTSFGGAKLIRVDLATRAIAGTVELPTQEVVLHLEDDRHHYHVADEAGRLPRVVPYPTSSRRDGFALVDLDDRRVLRTATAADDRVDVVASRTGPGYLVRRTLECGYVDAQGVMRGAVTLPDLSSWDLAGETLWIVTPTGAASLDQLSWTALNINTFAPRGVHPLSVEPAPALVADWNRP